MSELAFSILFIVVCLAAYFPVLWIRGVWQDRQEQKQNPLLGVVTPKEEKKEGK